MGKKCYSKCINLLVKNVQMMSCNLILVSSQSILKSVSCLSLMICEAASFNIKKTTRISCINDVNQSHLSGGKIP